MDQFIELNEAIFRQFNQLFSNYTAKYLFMQVLC